MLFSFLPGRHVRGWSLLHLDPFARLAYNDLLCIIGLLRRSLFRTLLAIASYFLTGYPRQVFIFCLSLFFPLIRVYGLLGLLRVVDLFIFILRCFMKTYLRRWSYDCRACAGIYVGL